MSVLGCASEAHWYCYNSQKFDGVTRASPQWSVDRHLNITVEALAKGVKLCLGFRRRGCDTNTYQHTNLLGEIVNVHTMMYGLDRGKTPAIKCKWLCVGEHPPRHTPKDQVEGRILPAIVHQSSIRKVSEWIKKLDFDPTPLPAQVPPLPVSPETIQPRPRQYSGRTPVPAMKNKHRKRKACEASLQLVCKSMNVDINTPDEVSKMLECFQSMTAFVKPSKVLTPNDAMELHFRFACCMNFIH